MTLNRKQKLEKILAVVRSVPEGAELLAHARQQKTRIALTDKKSIGGAKGMTTEKSPRRSSSLAASLADDAPKNYVVFLDEKLPLRTAVLVLVHELRHVWQAGRASFSPGVGASPRVAVAHERLLEGDAEAFAAMFKARLDKKPFAKADWKKAFIAFQKSAGSRKYDALKLAGQAEIITRPKYLAPAMRRSSLSMVFDTSAARGLRGVDQILVSGLSSQAAPYLQARDAEALADSVLRHAPAATRKKVARLEKTIRTGKL
jgi:hypothetical protein